LHALISAILKYIPRLSSRSNALVTVSRLLCCILLLALAVPALSQQPVFRNYGSKDGLSSNEVYCAFQDSKGFIWFGTDGGLSRFDGYSFRRFTSVQGLADNTIFGIQEDRHGRLWFRSLSGKISYFRNDSIYSIAVNDSVAYYVGSSIMTSMYVDRGDTIWCGLRALSGYFWIAPPYAAKDFHYVRIGYHDPYLIRIEADKFIWGSVADLRYHVLPVSGYYDVFNRQSLVRRVEKKQLDAVNILVAGMGGDSVMIAGNKEINLICGNRIDLLRDLKDFLPSPTSFLKRLGDECWYGMYGRGVRHFQIGDPQKKTAGRAALEGLTVTDVLKDKEGGTWFSTLEQGVFYASSDHFILNTVLPGSHAIGNPLRTTTLGNCLLSSSEIDEVDLIYTDTILKHIPIQSPVIRELLRQPGLQFPLMINTGSGYVANKSVPYICFGADKPVLPFRDSLHTVLNSYLAIGDPVRHCIYGIGRFCLYVCYEKDGFVRKLSDLPARVFSAYLDADGILWLGAVNGLWSYSNGKYSFHGKEHPYLASRINDIRCLPDGSYIYATLGNGLILRKGNSYTRIGTAEGLPSNNCECLLIDSYQKLWVGTKNGLACLSRKYGGGWASHTFSFGGDLLNQKISEIHECGKTLWVRSEYGLISHPLPVNPDTESIPPVFITRFTVNGQDKQIDSVPALASNQSDLQISYIGLSYRSFGQISYQYRLLGLDTLWHITQGINIHYPFLPPGSYSFEVRVFGKNVATAVIHFIISKPFWEANWFRLLALLLAGVLIYLALLGRIRSIQKKEADKTALSQQIATIEMKALRAQMNPHFIFNAINSIQNHIIKNDRRTAQDYLAKFARLIRNVLENSKSENIFLIQEIETLQLYLELEQLRAPGKFTSKIDVAADVPAYEVMIPPLLLQPFVENAILHGVLPLPDSSGHILISICRRDQNLVCIIEDNGIGREKSAELKQKKAMSHRSLGLSVTEERIHILNALHAGRARMVIDEPAEGHGTRVTLVLPLLFTERKL
jgi:hypothetical protein